MDKALLRVLVLLPIWLVMTAMVLGFLGGGFDGFDGISSRAVAYGLTLAFFLAYFPVAIWMYRRKGSDK